MREKVIIAGIDIADQVAKDNKLPPVSSDEIVLENYATSKLIDLAYKMGLLTRPEWKKIGRVYEIRRDLEHEDDEYEADMADCMYIFKACIDIILSKDPIRPIRVTEIKDIVESPEVRMLEISVIKDYERAPYKRQDEIYKYLLSNALNANNPEITIENCISTLNSLRDITNNKVLLNNATNIISKLGRRTPTYNEVRVYYVAGIISYFRRDTLIQFFNSFSDKLNFIGNSWKENNKHENILLELKEIGGLKHCPKECINPILTWLILCYIGESGGYGQYGGDRDVFYSNVGAPLSYKIINISKKYLGVDSILNARKNSSIIVVRCRSSKHVERRYQDIIDLFNE